MSLNKIVITREPGTEKTSLIHALTKKEHTCLEKISRLATINVRKEGLEQLFINQSFLFSEKLLEGCVKQYRTTLNLFTNLVFLDKCLPKVFTYIDFTNESCSETFIYACKNCTDTQVYGLASWQKISVCYR